MFDYVDFGGKVLSLPHWGHFIFFNLLLKLENIRK